jgi:hypothetical protein
MAHRRTARRRPASVRRGGVISTLDWVMLDGKNLAKLPAHLKTLEVCLAAVRQNGEALAFVPQAMITPEVYLAALEQNGNALLLIQRSLRTPELCLAAVQQNGYAIRYVPWELQSLEVIETAIAKDPGAKRFVSKKALAAIAREERRGVSEVAVKKGLPEGITQFMGKFFGGRRRTRRVRR